MLAQPLEYLFSLEQFGIKLGLDNIRVLCEALGHPDRSFASIIVAGTNGKGSVAATLETALRRAGYRTGRFTSPHLVRLEERFAIDGRPVSEQELAEESDRLHTLIDTLLEDGRLAAPPTFFEATTAIALSLFRRTARQVSVLEVGMGGRFDATNVVTPVAVAIPSIDFDHQEHLGSTLAEIAFEKAGVIKPGTLVVTGETKPEPLEVLRRICRERDARLVEATQGTLTKDAVHTGMTKLEVTTPDNHYGPVLMGLRGRHQVRNAVVTIRLLENLTTAGLPVPREAILTGLTETRWAGRLDLVDVDSQRSILLDAAHNIASIDAFAGYVGEVWPAGLPLVFGAMRDKDMDGMAHALGSTVTALFCPPLTSQRALAPEEVVARLGEARPDLRAVVAPSIGTALDMAWDQGPVIGATGSVFLVGELLAHLGLRP